MLNTAFSNFIDIFVFDVGYLKKKKKKTWP